MSNPSIIKTKYGIYTAHSKGRLNLTYDYENNTLIAFAKTAELLEVSHFFDIGANIGCYSVYLSAIEGIKKILAFEPAPVSFKELNKNIVIQPEKEKISSFEIALSDSKKQESFLIISDTSGVNRIDGGSVQGEHIEVNCEPLDALIKFKNKKIAIKIDVEGHEFQVIAGMKELIKNNHCLIQVECLEEDLALRLKKIMLAHGYILVFELRDDYIFLSESLAEYKDKIQQIYFKAIRDDLRELLILKNNKRENINKALSVLISNGYPYDPIMLCD